MHNWEHIRAFLNDGVPRPQSENGRVLGVPESGRFGQWLAEFACLARADRLSKDLGQGFRPGVPQLLPEGRGVWASPVWL